MVRWKSVLLIIFFYDIVLDDFTQLEKECVSCEGADDFILINKTMKAL